MATQEQTEEKKFDAILNAIPWRCFHCDFVTNDPAEAQAHFGDRDDAEEFKPVCKWWDRMSEDERIKTLQDTLKDLEAERNENDRKRVAIEGLEYQVDSIPSQIKSYKPFRGCNSIYDVFCVYDSMEGRALAAEQQLAGNDCKVRARGIREDFNMAFHHPNRSHRKPQMGAKAYPLRKILGTRMVEILLADGKPSGVEIIHEVLECGHTMRPRADFVGETNATKRRCLKCYQERKPENKVGE